MKLLDNQLEEPSLSKLGEEACRLFIARDFRGLADTFGYALAYNQDIAAAIEADFNHSFSGGCTPQEKEDSTVESITVRHFQPNDMGFLAVIECVLAFGREVRVLIELMAVKNGDDNFLYLEDINTVAPPSTQSR